MMSPKKLLLSGFEPFGGSSVNPTEQIARILNGQAVGGMDIVSVILPVEAQTGPAALLSAVQHHQPAAVLCLGQAARRAVLSIERLAINLLDYALPDNAGLKIVDQPVVEGGPAAYFVTLSVRSMSEAILAAGIPAELSLSAGTFLCNQVLYTLLYDLDHQHLPIPAGFIHVPLLPEQASQSKSTLPSMSLKTSLEGITAAIEAIASG